MREVEGKEKMRIDCIEKAPKAVRRQRANDIARWLGGFSELWTTDRAAD